MKKLIHICSVILLFVSCTTRNNVETKIELSSSLLVLSIGQDTILEATVKPKGLDIEWISEDEHVATVFAGIVTAISEGTTTITAKAGTASANCVVIVEQDDTPVVTPQDDLSDAVRFLPRSQKRGVGFSNPFYEEDVTLLSNTISWVYNWGPNPSSAIETQLDAYNIDFCPMAWNASYNKDRIRTWVQTHPNCQYLLAYNEPNLKDQARMTPQEAANTWPDLKSFAQELGLSIVAPAMNYGTLDGYSDPIKWLDEFFACDGVSIDDVDALALHCYMGSAGSMKSFIDRFDKYDKPIWMTEFCGWEAPVTSAGGQKKYMSEVVLMLETDTRVQRYAWFLARGSGSIDNKPWNQLLTKTDPYTLSDQGLIYEGLSTLDKSIWLNPANHILMNTCSNVCSISDVNPMLSPHFLPANDAYRTLYMANFTANKWVEFQIEADKNYNNLNLCYLAYSKTKLQVFIDGEMIKEIELSRSSDEEWHILTENIPLSQGKHIVRLVNISGNTNIHWMLFN